MPCPDFIGGSVTASYSIMGYATFSINLNRATAKAIKSSSSTLRLGYINGDIVYATHLYIALNTNASFLHDYAPFMTRLNF